MERLLGTDRVVLALGALLLFGAALLVPGGYLLLSARHTEGIMAAEAEVVAHEVTAAVSANPDLWRFEQVRLEELLRRRLGGGEPAGRRVLDAAGQVVVEAVDPLDPPVIWRAAPVLDAGAVVGRVEVARSLRPAVRLAALLALLLLPLAGAVVHQARRFLVRQAGERTGLEERLRQAQRLEAIGRLAGGVAHDFNNLLAAVLGFARELREDLPPDSPQQEAVAEILAVSMRGVQLTRSLLAFSRRQALELDRVDVGELVTGLERLLRSTLGQEHAFRLEPGRDPLPVQVDRVQLELVLVNLVANARDAMEPGGTLTVRTAAAELPRGEAEALGLSPGPYARLSVSDTGAGMDAATRERIFDPFFTTKPVGRGTGLGLSIAHGVVQQHGGAILVASAPGQGTTFTLLFPRAPPEAQEAAAGAAAPGGPSPRGRETVLVAEDDRHVRRVMRRLL